MTLSGVRRGVPASAKGVETAAEMTSAPDPLTFDAFYRARYSWAVSVAHLLTGDRCAAEELVQDSFSRMHGRFDELESPAAFLRVCVVNATRSWHRRQAREARFLRASAPPPAAELEVQELLDAVDRLPYRQKAVIVLRYYADLSEAEIAGALDCPCGTVKSLASRALARLEKEVER